MAAYLVTYLVTFVRYLITAHLVTCPGGNNRVSTASPAQGQAHVATIFELPDNDIDKKAAAPICLKLIDE